MAAVLVAALALVPLGYVAAAAIGAGADLWPLLWRPRVGQLLINTVVLVGIGVSACVTLGTAAAWLVERTDLPARGLWTILMTAPLAIPAFVNSFGWYSLSPSFAGLWAAVLVTTLSYFPLVFLPVAAVLRGCDPALEEAARSLGMGAVSTFRRVVLPQLRPAILGGGLLVGLHLLAEFGAIQALRYDTFTTAIYDLYQSTFNGIDAAALAAVLVALCLVLLVGEAALGGRARVARTGRGATRAASRLSLGPALPVALLGMTVLAVAALGVPLGCLVRWLTTSTSTAFPMADLARTAGTTLGLAAGAAAVTVVLAFSLSWLVVRRPGPLSRVLERCSYIGSSLPGIVVALALVTVAIRWAPAIYQTVVTLVAAYAILFLPRAVVSLRAALTQTPPELELAGRSLGLRPTAVVARVTAPLLARGAGAGAALVFLAVVTELTSTLLLAPTGTRTLATQFWSESSSINYGAAAPYALLMVVLSAPAAWMLARRGGEPS